MHIDLLLETLKTTLQKSKVEKLANIVFDEKFSVKELIDLTFYKDEQIGFRAGWILENVFLNHQERFLPEIYYFLGKFSEQKNTSVRRHFSKILALITSRNASVEIKGIIAEYPTEHLVETGFGWLIDERVAVAIKSHCLNVLANLATKHDWIKHELIQTIDYLVDKESIAFYAKVKQIRKQLR